MSKSLDLGCGLQPKNPFNAQEVYGVDVRDDAEAHIVKADLVVEPIPFPDNSFEYVTAHDFLEHIPRLIYAPQRRNAFVEVMNEIHRVLKPIPLHTSLSGEVTGRREGNCRDDEVGARGILISNDLQQGPSRRSGVA